MLLSTSCYPEHSHDPDDGGVDGQGSVDLDLLQSDTHYRQQHYGQVQLIPPTHKKGPQQRFSTESSKELPKSKCTYFYQLHVDPGPSLVHALRSVQQ